MYKYIHTYTHIHISTSQASDTYIQIHTYIYSPHMPQRASIRAERTLDSPSACAFLRPRARLPPRAPRATCFLPPQNSVHSSNHTKNLSKVRFIVALCSKLSSGLACETFSSMPHFGALVLALLLQRRVALIHISQESQFTIEVDWRSDFWEILISGARPPPRVSHTTDQQFSENLKPL